MSKCNYLFIFFQILSMPNTMQKWPSLPKLWPVSGYDSSSPSGWMSLWIKPLLTRIVFVFPRITCRSAIPTFPPSSTRRSTDSCSSRRRWLCKQTNSCRWDGKTLLTGVYFEPVWWCCWTPFSNAASESPVPCLSRDMRGGCVLKGYSGLA